MTQEAQAALPVTTIDKAGQFAGRAVKLQGWLYNMREAGKLLFPIFRDGTGVIQGVVSLKEQPAAFEALKGLTQELASKLRGRFRLSRARRAILSSHYRDSRGAARAGERSLSDSVERARRRFSLG